MSTKKLIKALGLIIVVALLAAALPLQAKAQEGGDTLYVAEWSEPANTGRIGRETVLKDGDTYHMWYYDSTKTKFYHTDSTNPASFGEGTEVTFSGAPGGAPVEVNSVSVVKEGSTFYMIAYGTTDKAFAIYTSGNGDTWTYGGIVFDGTSLTNWNKIDAPFLFKDGNTYRLYFQVKTPAESPTRYDIYTAESTAESLAVIAGTGDTVDFTLANSNQPVLSPGELTEWDGAYVMHPWVVKDGDVYYMWYSAHNGTDPHRLGMAKSTNGLNWVKSPANPILPDPTAGYAEPSVIKDGNTWRMWLIARTGDGVVYYDATGPFEFQSIQAAIDAASDGDTINVAAGTYNEDLEIGKSITLLGPNAAISPNTGTRVPEAVVAPLDEDGVADIAVLATNGNSDITIKGFTFDMGLTTDPSDQFIQAICKADLEWVIENNIFKNAPDTDIGYWQFTGCGASSTVVIEDNLFTNNGVSNGITMWDANRIVTVKDNVWKDNAGWAVNFNLVTGTFTGNQVLDTVNNGPNWYDDQGGFLFAEENHITMTNNIMDGLPNPYIRIYDSFSGTLNAHNNIFKNAQDPTLGAIRISAGANLSSAKFENNSFINVPFAVENLDSESLDASPNWWGNVAGPGASQISGPVDFTPWCTDVACTAFAPVNGVVELSGNISVPGGILINEPGITYQLAANTVIQNNSPCFVVNASFTKIYAQPGAKCIPVGGANGIDVAAGLTDIRVSKLEIDGSGQSTGDGIHFAGAINGVVLADNKIHGLDGDGVEFVESPTGTVDIHGNLFASNGGFGINNSDTTSPTVVAAEYNSWGSYYGPTGEGGDGVSSNVDADPYTYGDFWMSSSGSPWADQVVKGQTITYTIKALVKEVIAADVTFTYPAGLSVQSSAAITTQFESGSLTHNAGARTFTYVGMSTNGNENGTVDLFSVTFTANQTMRNISMDIVNGSFGMAGVGSSSNVYVQSIDDGSITVIDLPTISSTDIQGYYLSGEERQFSVVLNNPSTGGNFAHVYVDFTIANAQVEQIEKIEYSVDNGANWVALGVGPGTDYGNDGTDIVGYFGKITGGGFPLAPDTSLTTLFRVTFKTREQGTIDYPTSYAISMSLKDADTADPDTELAAFTKTAYVYDKPTLSSTDIQGYYLSGEQREFSVVLNNPSTGGNFAHVYINYMIADADMDEIDTIEYSVDHTNWVTLGAAGSGTSYEEDGSGNIVGYFGQIAGGGFPMAPNSSQTTWFRVTFKTREQGTTDYPTSYAISMQLMDADFTPDDRKLTDFSATANVYDKPSLTSTDIVGPYIAGVAKDFHVTVNNPATGGNFVDSIYYVFTIANAEVEDIYSLVCDGNSVTFTQSGPNLVGRTGYGGHGFPMPAGQEWITTCNVKFKNAGSYSFTVDMVDNPSGVIANDRILVSMSQTATVNSGFAITGTFTMQGNLNRGGIPVTLTWTGTGWTYAESDTTEDLLENNFQVTVTYGGGYLITTNQPRYLNLTTASAKSITVDGAKTLNALMLRGGNVVNADTSLDKIDLSDAGLIGGAYGDSGNPLEIAADANFDGKVNILDLALVGGNFELTSANAYTGWEPLP